MKYHVSFHAKTWYLHIWKYHHCYAFIINHPFHTKKLLKWNGLVVGFYIINRTLHGRLEIWNFSSYVEKIFHLFAVLNHEIFFNTWREIRISARPCNILCLWHAFQHFLIDNSHTVFGGIPIVTIKVHLSTGKSNRKCHSIYLCW